MKIHKCKDCGLDVTRVKTKKGTTVVCDVYWDGDYKIYEKNHQPIPHNCKLIRRRKNV